MGLVGPGQHASGKGGRGRDDGIVAGDVELLDEEGAEEEQRPVIFAHQRQPVGDRGMEHHVGEILLLHRARQEVEQGEHFRIGKHAAYARQHPLAAAKIRAPVVNHGDARVAVHCRHGRFAVGQPVPFCRVQPCPAQPRIEALTVRPAVLACLMHVANPPHLTALSAEGHEARVSYGAR
jgi:hypothetical protein